MIKDPFDAGRTQELPFEKMEMIEAPVTPVEEAEPEFKSALSPEAAEAAKKKIRSRSFSARNPHLGKMIKCQVCGLRHRAAPKRSGEDGPIVYETSCMQKFTNVKGEFEYFREDPGTGTLVPDLRTAIDPQVQPTPRQIMGAAAFAKRRHNPHLNALNLQLVERTRKVFAEMGFTITESKNPEIQKQAHLNMAIARKEALRQIINSRRGLRARTRDQSKLSRRINWGLTK